MKLNNWLHTKQPVGREFHITTIYATNEMVEVNEHGDSVWIGEGEDGRFSINVMSNVRGESSYAIVSRQEMDRIRAAIGLALKEKE